MPAFDPFGSLAGATPIPSAVNPRSQAEAVEFRNDRLLCLLAFDAALTACGAADPRGWSPLSDSQADSATPDELVFSHVCGLFALIHDDESDPRGPRILARATSLDTLRPSPASPPSQLSAFWPAITSDPQAADQARNMAPLVCQALYESSLTTSEQWLAFLTRGGRLDPIAVRAQFIFGIGYSELHHSLFILAIPELYWRRHRDAPPSACQIEALLPRNASPLHRGGPNTWGVSSVRNQDQALDLALLLMKMGFTWSPSLQIYCDAFEPACPIGPFLKPISDARALEEATPKAPSADYASRRL